MYCLLPAKSKYVERQSEMALQKGVLNRFGVLWLDDYAWAESEE
jgi:hypothetical protein